MRVDLDEAIAVSTGEAFETPRSNEALAVSPNKCLTADSYEAMMVATEEFSSKPGLDEPLAIVTD